MILRAVVPQKKAVDQRTSRQARMQQWKGQAFYLHHSKAIATCIAFSFVYHSRHPNLSLIPTILTSNEGFVVFLYDSEKDVFLKCGLPWKQKYLLVLWAVLNHKLFLNSAKVNVTLRFEYHKNNGRQNLKNVAPQAMRYMVEHLQRPVSSFQQLLHADTVDLRSGEWKLFEIANSSIDPA